MPEIVQSTVPHDRLGQIIAPGDYIAYGHSLGRSSGLQLGRVLRIEHVERYNHLAWKITVWAVNEESWKGVPEKMVRASILQYPDRMIVIPLDRVPAHIVALLQDVEVK